MSNNKPLRRGVDGVCTRSTCECEREGLGEQCVWLKPAEVEFECLGEPSLCDNPRGCNCPTLAEPHPSCKTPDGCRENGCLGWCDEHKPPTRSQKMRAAGYTRRPNARSLPSDE